MLYNIDIGNYNSNRPKSSKKSINYKTKLKNTRGHTSGNVRDNQNLHKSYNNFQTGYSTNYNYYSTNYNPLSNSTGKSFNSLKQEINEILKRRGISTTRANTHKQNIDFKTDNRKNYGDLNKNKGINII